MSNTDKKIVHNINNPFKNLDIVPVKRRNNLADQIVEVLLSHINSGVYAPGDQLPTEQQLSEAFEVSRAVVREAVARLKQLGTIRTQQGRGVFVVGQIEATPIFTMPLQSNLLPSQIMELRRVIEPAAARLAAQRRNDTDIAALIHENTMLEKAGIQLNNRAEVDMRFHRAVAVASNNPLFVLVIETLNQAIIDFLTLAHSNTSKVTGAYSAAENEHKAIAKAIIEGNAEEAEKFMLRHLERSSIRLSIS